MDRGCNVNIVPPAELTSRKQWVLWRYEQASKPDAKPNKVPYHPKPFKASHSKPSHWVPFADAVAAYEARPDFFSGIGFVFTPGDPYTGIDFDHCLDAHGTFSSAWAESWVRRLNSRTEISPSGRGVKVFVRGSIPAGLKNTRVELYNRVRFFTITGNLLPGLPETIRDAQPELDALYAEERPTATAKATTDVVITSECDDQAVRTLLNSFTGHIDSEGIPYRFTHRSQGRAVLREALAGWPKGAPDYSLERCKLVNSLAMHGYDDAFVTATLLYYRPALNGGGKSVANWHADIARLIVKARTRYPNSIPTPSQCSIRDVVITSPIMPEPPKPERCRARKDRPQRVSGADGYLIWLRGQADANSHTVMLSARECADRLGCTLRSIRRYESDLRGRGLIERRAYANRQAGCIFILEAVSRSDNISYMASESTPQTVVTADRNLPQPEAENAESASSTRDTRCVLAPLADNQPACVPCSDSPPIASEHTPQSLDQLVAEAIDAYGIPPEPSAAQIAELLSDAKRMAQLQQRKPNTPPNVLAFKAIKRQNTATHQAALRGYVLANSQGHAKAAISQALRTELLRRDLQTATPAMLRSQLKLFEKRYETERKAKSRSAGWWWFAAELVKQEQQRRPSEPSRTPRRETAPQPSAAVQQQLEAFAWDALENDRKRNPQPRHKPQLIRADTAKPSAPEPACEYAPDYWRGMVERFKAMKERPGQGAPYAQL